jgi:SAM-dependent methyltransferase
VRPPETERADCEICGFGDGVEAETIEWKSVPLRYAICPGCGLKYMRERPTRAWYADFYRDEFWQSSRIQKQDLSREPVAKREPLDWKEDPARSAAPATDSPEIQAQIKRQKRRAERVFRIVSACMPLGPDQRVLEIGAGFGENLNVLRQRTGCRVMAVEPSSFSAGHIEMTHDIPVVGRTLEELAGARDLAGSLDLAILSQVLENTVEPVESLRIVRRLLSGGGRLYIDTCNLYYNNSINPYHPYVFSPETLRAALGRAGFAVEYAEHAPHPDGVTRLTRSADGVDPVDRALYLAVVAVPGAHESRWEPVDVDGLLAAQRHGARLMRRARRWRKIRKWLGASIGSA